MALKNKLFHLIMRILKLLKLHTYSKEVSIHTPEQYCPNHDTLQDQRLRVIFPRALISANSQFRRNYSTALSLSLSPVLFFRTRLSAMAQSLHPKPYGASLPQHVMRTNYTNSVYRATAGTFFSVNVK